MHVPEIIEVKEHLEQLKVDGKVSNWELPYENILTRRSAAIFFVEFPPEAGREIVWKELEKYEDFSYRENTELKLSSLAYRVTFSEEEKEKNSAKKSESASETEV